MIDEEEYEEEVSMPQEIEQAFKKISKRDGTTRTKGFNELLEYLKGCNEDEEISKLAFLMRGAFIKIFKKFIICGEKSNRLAVAELTRILIQKSDSKQFLQPILKEILTLWLLSLFDPSQEVSNLQRKTFESVFPVGTKLKILLEKFESKILKEISEFSKNEEKFNEIKEIILNEMDGTLEEAETAIELVKTEIIGVLSLFLPNPKQHEEIKKILFLNDKEISSSRRCALYRFSLKFESPQFNQSISLLLSKEISPSSICSALDLLEKTEREEILKTLEREKFTISVLSNAPISEFKRFSNILIKNRILNAVDWFLNICQANNLMNKERFLSFWKDIAKGIFKELCCNDENRLIILEKLMFSNKRNANNLTAFLPLTAEETMFCLLEAFEMEEILKVAKGKNSPQSAFALSFIKAEEDLEIVLKNLSLSEIQNKELMKILPEEILTKRLVDSSIEGEILTTSVIVRLIQILPIEKAIKVLVGRRFDDWEKLLKSSLLQKNTVKNVLFRIGNFREFAKSQTENLLIISCAFESEIKVFESVLDSHVLEEALELVTDLQIRSPLLKTCIKTLYDHPKIKNITKEQRRELFEFIELQKDAELFVEFDCKDEDFYPIYYIENLLTEYCDLPCDPIEILLFKPKASKADWILRKLVRFPLKKSFKYRKLVGKCAFLNNLTSLITFKMRVDDITGNMEKLSDFEVYCMSKVVEEIKSDIKDVSGFKEAVLLYEQLKSLKDSLEINQILDELIFSDGDDQNFLAIVACIEPVLPIRSDNLNGLISKLKNTCSAEKHAQLPLLLASRHLEREEIKKEFWQVQFREVYKEILVFKSGNSDLEKELLNRVAGGIWDKLSDPEIEILKDCNFKESLEGVFKESARGIWESFGLARLVLMTAPFMESCFELGKLVEYYKSDALISPAMELALRSVYLQLYLDENLVAASIKLDLTADFELDEIGRIIFPFYDSLVTAKDKKFAVLMEMFVSAAEGSREDMKLLGAFADILKTRILPKLVNDHVIEGTLEEFSFVPRDFECQELIEHVIHRLCAIFPLIISQGIPCDYLSKSQSILQQREIERIRRQPRISVESVEILLKPILTSTTRLINLKVKFLDEIELLIDLILPSNFPLEPVRVEGKEKSGLAESKWKSALLSLQTLLRSPTFSGNLIEVIKKWQANALKLFQGLEECAVCYSVLHSSDKSLPGPACKQCKHKFHATCLYKWFKSSGNATCPLCRALF